MIQFNRVTKSFGARLSLARHERFWLAGILLLALALRVWDIGARSLWYDEACEYWVAVAPLSQLAHFVSLGSGDPPLYAFLLHYWMKLGTSEAWLRAMSALVSLAGVAGLMVLGRRLAGPSAAIAAGLLAAVNPPDIRYAQEVGQYALMLGTVAWSLVALHGLWNEGGRKWIVAWSLLAFSATASYYAAVFPVLVPFGCALVEALVRRDRSRIVRLVVALGIYVAVTTPVLWSVLPDQLSRVLVTRDRIAEIAQQRPEGLALVWRWLGNLFAFHFSGFPSAFVPGVDPRRVLVYIARTGTALAATLGVVVRGGVGGVRRHRALRAVPDRISLGADTVPVRGRAGGRRSRRGDSREMAQAGGSIGVRGARRSRDAVASKPDRARRNWSPLFAAVARDRGRPTGGRILACAPVALARSRRTCSTARRPHSRTTCSATPIRVAAFRRCGRSPVGAMRIISRISAAAITFTMDVGFARSTRERKCSRCSRPWDRHRASSGSCFRTYKAPRAARSSRSWRVTGTRWPIGSNDARPGPCCCNANSWKRMKLA